MEQRVEIKSAQTEQAIFNSQELRLRLSKVEEEKVNIEFQVRIEEHQISLKIQALQDQVSQMKVQHDQSEEVTQKVDKEKRLIENQFGAATDTHLRLREELVNAREQGKTRVQNVYDEAGFQMQKLREQLEMKEKNNSSLRKVNAT